MFTATCRPRVKASQIRPATSMVEPDTIAFSASTRLGWLAFAVADDQLAKLTFGHESKAAAATALGRPVTAKASGRWAELIERLQAYADGSPESFNDVPVALDQFTDFTQRVLRRCQKIGYGEALSYQQLAAAVGRAGAARAVGQVMSRNPVPLIIPCHRVIAAGGRWGGFSAPQGVSMKQRLLRMEGFDIG